MNNLLPMRYNAHTGTYESSHTINDPYYRIPPHVRNNPRMMRMIIEEHRKAYHSITIMDMIPEVPEFACRHLFDAGKILVIDDAPDIGMFGQRFHHGLLGGLLITLSQLLGTMGKLMSISGGMSGDDLEMSEEEIEEYAGPLEYESRPSIGQRDGPIYYGKITAKEARRRALPPPVVQEIPDIPGVP